MSKNISPLSKLYFDIAEALVEEETDFNHIQNSYTIESMVQRYKNAIKDIEQTRITSHEAAEGLLSLIQENRIRTLKALSMQIESMYSRRDDTNDGGEGYEEGGSNSYTAEMNALFDNPRFLEADME